MVNNIKAAATIAVLGVLLFTVLLITRMVSETTYTALFGLTAFASLALLAFPRLKEIDVRNLRITLADLEQIQSKVEKTKAEIAEMYGGIERLRKSPLVLDDAKMRELGLDPGNLATASSVMRYTAGCITRERERLASILVSPKSPEEIAAAILDKSLDDRVFKWNGPEVTLSLAPVSVDERKAGAESASDEVGVHYAENS